MFLTYFRSCLHKVNKGRFRAETSHNPKKQIRSHLLSNANDWKFLTDLPGTNYVFPPEVYSTPERPDILIWSPKLRTILMLELTCPAEEGIQAAKLRKQRKYMPLF